MESDLITLYLVIGQCGLCSQTEPSSYYAQLSYNRMGHQFCLEVLEVKIEVPIPCSYINPYPTAFPYGNGMVLHFYQQQESSTTKTVHKVINKGLKTYV